MPHGSGAPDMVSDSGGGAGKRDKRRRTKPKEGEKQTIYARTWGDVVAGGLRLTGDVGVLELWIISALL